MLRCSLLRCLAPCAVAAVRISTVTSMGKKNVYAVAQGRRPGLYRTWDECRRQVEGYRGNKYAGFGTEQEALRYLEEHCVVVPGLSLAAAEPERAQEADAAVHQRAEAAASALAADATVRKRKQPTSTELAAHAAAPVQPVASRLIDAATLVRLEFDGASKRNPGPAGFGAVLYDDATGQELARMCRYMGDYHTNNQAEYAGLIAGLAAALELGCRRIRVQGDSTLIIKQVLGEWRVKHEGLQPYHAAAVGLMRRFESFQARQVRREYNKAADALSNQAIDDYRCGANSSLWRLEEAMQQAALLADASGVVPAAGEMTAAAVVQGDSLENAEGANGAAEAAAATTAGKKRRGASAKPAGQALERAEAGTESSSGTKEKKKRARLAQNC